MNAFQNWLRKRPLDFKVKTHNPPFMGVTGAEYTHQIFKRRRYGILRGRWKACGLANGRAAIQAIIKRETDNAL